MERAKLATRGRNSGSASAGDRPEPQVGVSGAAPEHRSADLRLAVPTVPLDSECDHSGQAGDRDPVAAGFGPIGAGSPVDVVAAQRSTDREIRDLIRRMNKENPLWGAPRIHSELLMLGIEVGESTVARYMTRRQGPPSQGWKTFLRNHAAGIASVDLFVVRTISFKLLYGLVILRHARRRSAKVSVTSNPTAEWIAGQVTDAFPWDEAPHHLIRDRDSAFGPAYTRRIRAMEIRDRPTAPRSPWQNGHVERLIGSIRRESLDHVVVLGEAHLRHVLKGYASYYNKVRSHLSLDRDPADFRQTQKIGRIAAIPILGGLHHQYVRG